MNWTQNLLRFILFLALLVGLNAYADNKQEIKQLIQSLYRVDVSELLCRDSEDSQNGKLIVVPERYFSNDFMKYYGEICKNTPAYKHWNGISFDPRTGQNDVQMAPNNGPPLSDFTNLKIGQPRITGNQATIRTIYDLPVATYQEYGNFTIFALIKENGQWKIDDIELGGHDLDKYNQRESMTGLRAIKSLKQYIKIGLIEAEAKKKASAKKKSQ